VRDLAARRKTLKFLEGEGRWASDQAVDRETPVGESAGLEALGGLVFGRCTIDRGNLGDFTGVEFAGQGTMG
jgi:hypothetical protein